MHDLALVDRPQVDLLREGEADKQVTAARHPGRQPAGHPTEGPAAAIVAGVLLRARVEEHPKSVE